MRNVFDLIESLDINNSVKLFQEWLNSDSSSVRRSVKIIQDNEVTRVTGEGYVVTNDRELLEALNNLCEKPKSFDVTIKSNGWGMGDITLKQATISAMDINLEYSSLMVLVSFCLDVVEVVRTSDPRQIPYYTIPQTMEWPQLTIDDSRQLQPSYTTWATTDTAPANLVSTAIDTTVSPLPSFATATASANGFTTISGSLNTSAIEDIAATISRTPQVGEIRFNETTHAAEYYSVENRWMPFNLQEALPSYTHEPLPEGIMGTMN